MKIKTCAAWLIATLGVGTCFSAHAYDLIALWESRNVSVTDTFYTTYYNDHRLALDQDGHINQGVAAWIPCSVDSLTGPGGQIPYKGSMDYPDVPPGDTANPSRYTHGYTALMNFACLQPAGATPLYRMYKNAPQTDHIYTISTTEFNSFASAGYAFDRVEGYVFSSQVSGSVPLYRLSLGVNFPNHDVEHRYTSSASAKQSLLNAGWSYEGITGYVFGKYINPTINATGYTGTFNSINVSPNYPNVTSIQNVIAPTQQLVFGGNSTTFQYGGMTSNVTSRPIGAVWQNASFNFFTGDIFSATSSLNHIPLYLHYASAATTNAISALPPYDGIALIISKEGLNGYHCGAPAASGQLSIEIGEGLGGIHCESNLSTPMQNNTWYTISYSLNDAAAVRIYIANSYTGQPLTFINGTTLFTKSFASFFSCPFSPAFGGLPANQSFCANPYNPNGFPVNNTGYMIYPLFTGASDTTALISNTRMQWLNANLNVLY